MRSVTTPTIWNSSLQYRRRRFGPFNTPAPFPPPPPPCSSPLLVFVARGYVTVDWQLRGQAGNASREHTVPSPPFYVPQTPVPPPPPPCRSQTRASAAAASPTPSLSSPPATPGAPNSALRACGRGGTVWGGRCRSDRPRLAVPAEKPPAGLPVRAGWVG
eukprot:Hpha_TRINITY_DN15602_c0_g1::TRINITY_DN15602_c0_g1_i3::g.101069::m.101069